MPLGVLVLQLSGESYQHLVVVIYPSITSEPTMPSLTDLACSARQAHHEGGIHGMIPSPKKNQYSLGMTQAVFAKQVLLQPLGPSRFIICIAPISINLDRTLIGTEQGPLQMRIPMSGFD